MHRKSFFLTLVAAMTVGFSAAGSPDTNDSPPIRTKNSSAIFIVRHGREIGNITSGLNQIGMPRMFHCKSANGCLVSFSAEVITSGLNVPAGICGFADSSPAFPECVAGNSEPTLVSRQTLTVGPGLHTLSTDLDVGSGYTSGSVTGWETDYTIYELTSSK
ncbi:MAG TPA: hypothetical protein VMF67_12585 [Rhizomicrobium sp.]|nr:hypothetical protein [Rhizomicrobium sp.]